MLELHKMLQSYWLQACRMAEVKFDSQYLDVFHVFLHIVYCPACSAVMYITFCVSVLNIQSITVAVPLLLQLYLHMLHT